MKKKIVIADDEAIIRMDLKEMLECENYEIIGEASDGQKAYELLMELNPDLAILDINMPKMTGLEVARKIKETKNIPIVILTAYSQDSTIEEAVDLGIYAYLVKPIREEQLFPALKVTLKKFEDYQNLLEELQLAGEELKGKALINEAVAYLQKHYEIDEGSAYRRIRKYSMEKRLSLKEIAASILKAAAEIEKNS